MVDQNMYIEASEYLKKKSARTSQPIRPPTVQVVQAPANTQVVNTVPKGVIAKYKYLNEVKQKGYEEGKDYFKSQEEERIKERIKEKQELEQYKFDQQVKRAREKGFDNATPIRERVINARDKLADTSQKAVVVTKKAANVATKYGTAAGTAAYESTGGALSVVNANLLNIGKQVAMQQQRQAKAMAKKAKARTTRQQSGKAVHTIHAKQEFPSNKREFPSGGKKQFTVTRHTLQVTRHEFSNIQPGNKAKFPSSKREFPSSKSKSSNPFGTSHKRIVL
jgi:hypothetical protein